MAKLEHFTHILLFEFNRGAKEATAARNICAVYGDNAYGFLGFMRLHVQEDLRGLMKVRLNTLIHNDPCQCTRELANVIICDHCTIMRHCIQWTRSKNRVYGYRML